MLNGLLSGVVRPELRWLSRQYFGFLIIKIIANDVYKVSESIHFFEAVLFNQPLQIKVLDQSGSHHSGSFLTFGFETFECFIHFPLDEELLDDAFS